MWKGRLKRSREIYPDEIFMDSANPSEMDVSQMEGKIVRPLSESVFWGVGAFFLVVVIIFMSKAWALQVVNGSQYREVSDSNRFRYTPILAERGFIYSDDGKELAWNEVNKNRELYRRYTDMDGFAHVVGYCEPPMKDSSGNYYRERYIGIEGAEEIFNEFLTGYNGLLFVEHNAQGVVYSENLVRGPRSGGNVYLSIDADLQNKMYSLLEETAQSSGFKGGAGIIMDVETGEIITATSFPEYKPSVMSGGSDSDTLRGFIEDDRHPFLNRFAGAAFTPGSVVKPFVAVAALEEGIIKPGDRLESPAFLSIPNPYSPANPSIFRDWKTHGSVDLYEALAVSSNIYFYKVGGGYRDLEGLGISKIEEYMKMFGFGSVTDSDFPEAVGNVPTPIWKHENFSDGVWRVGDTYNTSIGQFGFQMTPIQLVRATASIANNGHLLRPTLIPDNEVVSERLNVSSGTLSDVAKGMRRAVTEGTASGLNVNFVNVAAKTGTAQTGSKNDYMNSWITGFFPYEDPKYAFVIVLDGAPSGTSIGGVYVMNRLLYWIDENRPEYLAEDRDLEAR